MPDAHKIYLDQMLRLEVTQALKDEGHDVLRASEVGQARADDYQILQKAIKMGFYRLITASADKVIV